MSGEPKTKRSPSSAARNETSLPLRRGVRARSGTSRIISSAAITHPKLRGRWPGRPSRGRRADEQAADRRSGHRRRLHHDRVQADGVRQVLARHQHRHQRLPRRRIEGADRRAQARPSHRAATPASGRGGSEAPASGPRTSPPLCVTSISFRRSHASATTPLIIENTTIGTKRTRPTKPSASALRSGGTSSDTCHSSAALCMNEPVNEKRRPHQRSRKLR